jgi:hypothetical protein
MCTTADALQAFGGETAATLQTDFTTGDPNQFDLACTKMNNHFTSAGEVEVTQSLQDLCISFDMDADSLENVHICVGLEEDLEVGGYVTGYLYWCMVTGWMLGGAYIIYLLHETIFRTHRFGDKLGNISKHLAVSLHPRIGEKTNSNLNWITHSLTMAFIHTFSVILAVYCGQAFEQYTDEDDGMNIKVVKEKVPSAHGSDAESYMQRTGDCFSSLPAFFTYNVALKHFNDEIDDAPEATQAVFYLSIITAALSGLLLFSYLIILAVVHQEEGGGSDKTSMGSLRKAIREAQDEMAGPTIFQRGRRMLTNRLSGVFRAAPDRNNFNMQEVNAPVGADAGVFNLQGQRTDVPASVAEEKQNGELFTKNVAAGESIMKLTF